MDKNFYLGQEDLRAVLDKLNTNVTMEEAKVFILSIYYLQDGTLKRHSYAHIGEYVKDNQELDFLFSNLDLLIETYAGEQRLIKIIFKIKDHLEIEMARQFERYDIQDQLTELRELKSNVETLTEKNEINLNEIKNMQGTITKEIVGIATILIAIITLVLGNIGAIEFINENAESLVGSGVTIKSVVFQVNAAIISGVSVLTLLISALIYNDRRRKFCCTPKFWIPLIVLISSSFILLF